MANQSNNRLKSLLKQKAEDLEKKSIDTDTKYSDIEVFNLIKELELHQLELEAQNQELSSHMIKAEIEAEKYTTLYNFAFCGYFTITKQDEIIELNFSGASILGEERSELLNKRFSFFVPDESKPTFFLFLEKIFETRTSQTCEIVLSSPSKLATYAIVTGIAKEDSTECLLTILDITERNKIENYLQKSQEKLEGIFNVANSGIFLIDKLGNFLMFNDWFCKSLGYTRDEFKNLNVKNVSHPEDWEQSKSLNQKIIDGEIDKYQIEKRYLRKDKSILWCEVSASAVKDQNNNVINIIKLVYDISDKILSREALEKSEARLIEAQALAKVGNWETDLSFTDVNWSEETEKILGLNSIDKQSSSPLESILAIVHPDDRLLVQTTFVHSIKNDTVNKFEHRILTPEGIEKIIEQRWKIVRNELGQPIRAIGTCYDITEQKLAEKLIAQSRTRFRSIINSSPVAMALNDENLNITYVNHTFVSMFGYTLEEIPTVYDWFPKAFPNIQYRKKISNSWITALETVKQTGEDFASMEVNISCKNGSIKRVKVSATRILNSYESEFLVNLYDITAQKKAEQALINEKRRLALILIGTGAGTWEWNIQTGFITINARWAELIGYTIEELAPISMKTWRKLTHPDDARNGEENVQKHFQGSLDYCESEFRMKHKNGHWVWILSRGKINKRDLNGEPLLMSGTHLDITKRKEAENAKEKAVNLFDNITSHVPGVVYQYLLRPDGSSCFPYASEAIKEIYKVTPEEVRQDASKVFEYIHPDDFESVAASIQKSAKYLIPWKHEYRVKFKDGEVRHLYGNAKPQKLADESVLWHGSITDVSENKIIENSLRESEEKYRGLVENALYGILIYVEDKIAFINDEGLRMLRAKDKKDVIGKSVLQFIHPDNLQDIAQRMKDVISNTNASAIVEAKFIGIDGIPFDAEIKAIPTVYERKVAVQVIVNDISLQKQAASELNKINRVYAFISQINNLIIRTQNREELFHEICNIAVDFGKFRLSCIRLLDDNNKIFTAAFAGYENGYFAESNVSNVLNIAEDKGPTGIAMREGRAVICNDIANDPIMKPWRKEAQDRGYCSMISIPLLVRNKKIGVFNLYSGEKNFFSSKEEISLLEKITLNIAFSLESILNEEDRLKSEEKIRQLSQAVEQSPVSIVITDTEGKIEYVNPKFVETTGYTLAEVLGQNPRFLKSGHTSAEEYKNLWQTINAGKEWRGELKNKKKDGTLFWESATISPIQNADGKTTHFIAIKENITDRKIAEQDLINAKLRAEESDRLKLAFLANMSHEIRTPMNGILGFTELLKAPNLNGKDQQEYIRIIEKSGKRMLNIINDIISISKIESGQIDISISETNINEQLNYILSFFTPEANQKGIQLIIKKQLQAKYNVIKTDEEKLYAILTNLVKNAIKFTNEGVIEFGCEKKGKIIQFYVKDSGIGISDSKKDIVFERFRQANESISRSHEGSGLGLPISKAYIEMLGGTIWVDSKIGIGSTFFFTLPFQSETDYDDENEEEEKIDNAEVDLIIPQENEIKDLKVLIVEDDAISKLLISIAVKPFSKEILKASSGIEAVEICSTNPDIDLVLMDINMPIMGGYEATKIIREFNKDLIIVAQTANGMQSDRDDAIDAGFTDYISKPINIKDLGALIQKYFNK